MFTRQPLQYTDCVSHNSVCCAFWFIHFRSAFLDFSIHVVYLFIIFYFSDWSSLSLYESELVHDIIESEEEVLDDEDDSNGN